MLTKEYMDKNFITAHFCDNERTQIEIITKTPDGKGINPTIVPFDKSNAWCNLLFEYIDLDTLHENTWTKIQDDRDAFKKVVWDIAKQDGILQEVGKKNAEDVFGIINDFIFKFDDTKTEQLFAFKLALFELEKVKNADNDVKSEIRKSKTPQEALMAVFSIK